MCALEIRDPMEKWKTTVPRTNFTSYEMWYKTSLSDKVSNFVACKLATFCIFHIHKRKEQFWFGMYFDAMTIVANEKCATFFHLCGFLWNVNGQYEYIVLYTTQRILWLSPGKIVRKHSHPFHQLYIYICILYSIHSYLFSSIL